MGLRESVEQSEGRTDLYLSGANPGGIFLRPLDLQFHVGPERLSSISMHQLPFGRTMSEELEDITLLLGSPDIITARELDGDVPAKVELTLTWLGKGAMLTYLADLAQSPIAGTTTDAICLASTPRRHAALFIATDLSYMSEDRFDWSRRMGISAPDLVNSLMGIDQCVPLYP